MVLALQISGHFALPRMLPVRSFRRSLVALAVGAAFSIPVHAAETDTPADPGIAPVPLNAAFSRERAVSAAVIVPIRADHAYGRSITGRGVTIAVLDTGVNVLHSEFSLAGRMLPGFNALNGSSNVTDMDGHGTHVAGILGGARDGRGMFGVAYDATLLPIKVLDDSGAGSTAYLNAGLRHAIGRASIVNMSLGTGTPYNPKAMQEAVGAGLLIVAAAGNEGAAHPNWPARFAREAWANNQIIAVGAVDAANRLTGFSNRAGDAAAWYMVAPGVALLSTFGERYAVMSGTSMAAPAVSGAAALVKQHWPKLRADQIANILFVTATDLGEPGIDVVYGRGLLNVEKALQPIGQLTTTTFNGSTISVLRGAATPSPATSQLWRLALSGHLRVLGFDDYQRDFSVDLGQGVSRTPTLSVGEVFGSLDRRIEVAESVLPGAHLSVAYEIRLPAAGEAQWPAGAGDARRLAAFSLVSGDDRSEAAFGVGGLAAQYFGIGGLNIGADMALGSVAALSNPYFTLVPSAAHAAAAYRAGGFKLKMGVLSSGMNAMLSSQDAVCTPGRLPGELPKSDSALFEVSKSFRHASMALSLTQTTERNSYLGAQSGGALALSPHATTSSIQFAGALLIASGWALAGQAAYGMTPGSDNQGSLIAEIGGARTNAFSLALVAANRIRAGDRFSFAMSQPMRTYSGHMVLDTVTDIDSDGNLVRDRVLLSMVPAGRELRSELNYQAPIGRAASIGTTFMLRRDPNNMVDAPTEKLVVLRFAKRF